MTTIRDIQDSVSGFRFVMEQLDLRSGMGRRFLLSQPFITDEAFLSQELNNVAEVYQLWQSSKEGIEYIQLKLEQVRDIQGTLRNISNAAVLGDIELFEVKHFSLLCAEIRGLCKSINPKLVDLPDLEPVIDLLDPEKQRAPHFYVHPLYSQELASLRQQIKILISENPEKAETLRLRSVEVEDRIRHNLSCQLFDFADLLQKGLEQLAYLDLLIAKAKLAMTLSLSKPAIAHESSCFKGLFNPHVKALLNAKDKDFQSIDIDLYAAPCLITGANMAGKTVLLKTIALAQYLFQFGFFVPAKEADMVLVEAVMVSMGDAQSELNGLSSYAAEMLNINSIVKTIKNDKKVLVLIDELARTTNPNEGEAIVSATIEMLQKYHMISLITTHYNIQQVSCRRLKVKGLMLDKLNTQITIGNINDFMDYSLVENESNVQSMEALQIASVLGVDEDLLSMAKQYMKNKF